MKTSAPSRFLLLTACVIVPASGLFAQAPAASPSAAATPSVSVPAGPADTDTAAGPKAGLRGKGRHAMQEKLAVLTPEEREKLRTAHQKAMQDPAVKAAEATRSTDRKGYREAMRTAMLRADPTIEPILVKMREARPNKKNF